MTYLALLSALAIKNEVCSKEMIAHQQYMERAKRYSEDPYLNRYVECVNTHPDFEGAPLQFDLANRLTPFPVDIDGAFLNIKLSNFVEGAYSTVFARDDIESNPKIHQVVSYIEGVLSTKHKQIVEIASAHLSVGNNKFVSSPQFHTDIAHEEFHAAIVNIAFEDLPLHTWDLYPEEMKDQSKTQGLATTLLIEGLYRSSEDDIPPYSDDAVYSIECLHHLQKRNFNPYITSAKPGYVVDGNELIHSIPTTGDADGPIRATALFRYVYPSHKPLFLN